MCNNQVIEYIEQNWDLCLKENRKDCGEILGVPHPYTVPAVGHFDYIYYWDTYFTNVGLILSGRIQQAKNNTDNILYLVNKHGFMPNGNHATMLDRSQPPFLSLMVRDVYEEILDKKWLNEAYLILEKEYEFWITERNTGIGLNRYGNSGFTMSEEHYADVYCRRVGYTPDMPAEKIAKEFLATAESGWDISPRFGECIRDYVPVDLNSLMYMFEKNMSYFSLVLENDCHNKWEEKSEIRKLRMKKYLESKDGLMLDFNYVTESHSSVFSAASFFLLMAEVVDQKGAEMLVENLGRLEMKYGILACEKTGLQGNYQWGYPNGWACLHYVVIHGLYQYGFLDDAVRVAKKFVTLVENVFEKTGNLWEKYNVVDGNVDVVNEYEMPPMMGWTAGVYLDAKKFLSEHN